MQILVRNTGDAPTSSDNRIRRTVSNIALLTLGYDANVTEKTFVNGNVGFGWAPSSFDAPVDGKLGSQNSSDFMGTELNLEAGYKVSPNLTLSARAAYAVLGGYYKNSTVKADGTPADPETPTQCAFWPNSHSNFCFT